MLMHLKPIDSLNTGFKSGSETSVEADILLYLRKKKIPARITLVSVLEEITCLGFKC